LNRDDPALLDANVPRAGCTPTTQQPTFKTKGGPMLNHTSKKEFLLLSDFDQTLSFNDSGLVLAEMMGIPNFQEHVRKLADTHFVQQGGELAYLLLHEPAFKDVRKHHLREAGKKVRLKKHIQLLARLLENIDGCRFSSYVVSAAPQEIVESALEGILPADHIFASQLEFNAEGSITGIACLRAGYGKVAILDQLRDQKSVGHNRLVYVGDGSSDVHVMLHVNRLDGLTIAVSENRYLTQIAKRSVLSDDALSILVPITEEILGWNSDRIRALFEQHGFILREWEKVQTDTLQIVSATRESETESARIEPPRRAEIPERAPALASAIQELPAQ
jgi:HAD superfamily phosphoserine phosphatase-like hydrolase